MRSSESCLSRVASCLITAWAYAEKVLIATTPTARGGTRSLALIIGVAIAMVAGGASADPMTTPGMTGPLSANANPTSFDAGPLGEVYITGAVSGLGFLQDHAVPGDDESVVDMSNGQVFIQKTDGPIQFFVQAGGYSLPSLGAGYLKAADAVKNTYGVLPQAFIKFVPNANFSIMAGKLPTLIGAEYTFTFENMNINRGLLWNQENAVNRGVQVNYSNGPLSVSVSWNDGFYSKNYSWASGLISYVVTPHDTVTAVAMGNLGHNDKSTFATPLLQNNSEIYNLIWSHNSGPWTITPYLQYTHVPASAELGIAKGASTMAGALLAKYAFTPEFSLAGRAEYIDSSGSVTNGAPSLLYGPGSKAWSLTLTPTYQNKIFYVRGEVAYAKANDTTPGFALGSTFSNTDQTRAMIEAGVLF